MSKPDKITDRAEYAKGEGYLVEVKVTFRRKRKVRALNEQQAKSFAAAREARYANKYFASHKFIDYSIDEVSAINAEKVSGNE